MSEKLNYSNLKKFSLSEGVDLFGVAGINEIKKDFALSELVLKRVDKAVALGVRLSEAVLGDIVNAPTRLYFHHYRTANAFLDQFSFKLSNYIQKRGYLAIPIPASQILDWQHQTSHLSHKKIGYLAGLGWIGRNNLLVNKKLGSQFRLVSILTNMPLEIDGQVKENCKHCRLCIEVCPCGAIKDNPADFDHVKCFEKLREFQRQRLTDQYICGICVNACRKDNYCSETNPPLTLSSSRTGED